MGMYRLYDYEDSGNGYKVRLLLHLLGTPYELVPVDILRGESRSPGFLAKNPNGKVPVLGLSDDRYLAESNAIMFHLAEGTPYFPTDAWERAQVMQWLFFEQYSHEPNIATVRYWLRHTEVPPSLEPVVAEKRKQGHAALSVMEQHLTRRTFFVAERVSIADIALYAYTHVAEEGGFDLHPYAAVRRWLDDVTRVPGYMPMASSDG